MPLTEKTIIDNIEVIEDGSLQIREARIIYDNGNEVGRTFRRWVRHPDDDISDQDDRVKEIAGVVWTPAVIDAFKKKEVKII